MFIGIFNTEHKDKKQKNAVRCSLYVRSTYDGILPAEMCKGVERVRNSSIAHTNKDLLQDDGVSNACTEL